MTQRRPPISQRLRRYPKTLPWYDEGPFLREAGAQSLRTEATYRSGLRLFADWLQHYRKGGYTRDDAWPLAPDGLSTDVVLEFRNWLLANRSRATVTTYMAAVMGYLNYLDGHDRLPEAVQLGKLQRQLSRRQIERNQSETVIDLDVARQQHPRIVTITKHSSPPENDKYNRRG
ncbi:MAG: hypothetical protein R3C44_05850 [Chloroflexota bacterium]